MTNATTQGYDPHGYVFISYRQGGEGDRIATDLEHLLRASGIPVWRDKTDLGPGLLPDECKMSASHTISAGILIVTENLKKSEIVRETELPAFLKVLDSNPEFKLCIVTSLKTVDGEIAWDRVDSLTPGAEHQILPFLPERAGGKLSQFYQHTDDEASLLDLVKRLQRTRAKNFSDSHPNSPLSINIETYGDPDSDDRTDSTLDIRTTTNSRALPSREALIYLKKTIGTLPTALKIAPTNKVLLRGGPHNSIAFTLGTTFLATSIASSLQVIDRRKNEWSSKFPSEANPVKLLTIQFPVPHSADRGEPDKVADRIAIYIDMVERKKNSDKAFEQYISDNAASILCAQALRLESEHPTVRSQDGGDIAIAIADKIDEISDEYDNPRIALFLRCPFALAALIGRQMNTHRIDVYEFDKTAERPRYLPMIRVTPSNKDGVITEVLAQ